jgi:hypothetical protein
MNRFQIEDIVEQDKHGVIFRALDVESGSIVSLRRFLPFGQDGGGLQEDEAVAFGLAADRLAGISHEALRSVILGAVDPIDGIPYLVTEWVDGMPLNELLAGENMDPALVIDVLRIALEVSIVLSGVLGEEAVWVETELESIIIGTKDSGRGFTFWISPFKWLGAQFGSRKLSSIVELGERLTGWKGKAVRDNAGYGLGGWLKWLKRNPDASLSEALDMMASTIGNETPLPVADPVAAAATKQVSLIAPKSEKNPVMIIAAALLLLACAALFYFQKIASVPPQISATTLSASERASARAQELQREAGKASKQKIAATPLGNRVYTPDDKELWSSAKGGTPVKLGGNLRRVQISSTGKSIYLFFSDPEDAGKLGGVVHRSSYKGDFREETFMPLMGKNLVLTGTSFKEPGGRVLVKIPDKSKIRVVE